MFDGGESRYYGDETGTDGQPGHRWRGLRDIHGMNGITEGVRQVRGTSCNQVEDVEHVLVTSGTGVPTSALILAPAD